MSVSASIDIKLYKRKGYLFSAENIINQMLVNGWRIVNNGKIFYLPLGDVDAARLIYGAEHEKTAP